jgi:nucleoside-diphosphate-sugar epimerase
MRRFCSDNRNQLFAEAKTILNWKPNTPLREGLAKTIAYFDELLSSNGGVKK